MYHSQWRLCLRTAILACTTALMWHAGCSDGSRADERAAIAWANQGFVAIDDWEAGDGTAMRDANSWNRWVARGRAIPNCETLLRHLLEAKDPRAEPILIVHGLAVVGSADSVPVLVAKTAEPWDVMRGAAVNALGAIGNRSSFPAVAGCLLFDDSANVRTYASLALVAMKDPRGIDVLQYALDSIASRYAAGLWGPGEDASRERRVLEKALGELRQKLSDR